jgi:hypothetical protein
MPSEKLETKGAEMRHTSPLNPPLQPESNTLWFGVESKWDQARR